MADLMIKIAKREKKPIDYGLLLQVKGVAQTSMGNNSKALELHMDSYKIFDSIKNKEGKIFAMVNIATVHLNLGNPAKAKAYLVRALAVTDKTDSEKLRFIYANLGVAYDFEEDPVKAISYYKKAIPHLERFKDYNGLAVNYHNIAEDYNGLAQWGIAEEYELKALEYQKKSGSKNTLAMVSLSLGHLYVRSNQLSRSKEYLEIGGKAARELQSPYYLETYYEEMANWHKASGDFKKSNAFLTKLIALREIIHSDESRQASALMEEQFQSHQKNKQIELLKMQKKLDAAKIEKSRFWWLLFLAVTILCVIVILVLYRNYKLKQKANLLLNRENSTLNEINARLENENILSQFETLKNQVSPHFLFNSLNALSSLIATQPKKAILFTNTFSKIFRSTLSLKDKHIVTLTEELHYVQAYLELQQMRFGDNLRVTISECSENNNQFLPPFSLQMVVENAIKHNSLSKSEPLHIGISVKDNFLIVTNTLQPRKFVEDSTGTGIKNIQSRYNYLTHVKPVFEIRGNEYYVQLPLISEE